MSPEAPPGSTKPSQRVFRPGMTSACIGRSQRDPIDSSLGNQRVGRPHLTHRNPGVLRLQTVFPQLRHHHPAHALAPGSGDLMLHKEVGDGLGGDIRIGLEEVADRYGTGLLRRVRALLASPDQKRGDDGDNPDDQIFHGVLLVGDNGEGRPVALVECPKIPT